MNKSKQEIKPSKPNTEAEDVKIIRKKIIIIGDTAVGKSCIVNQFCHEFYTDMYKPTLGCDFYTKILQLNDVIQVHLQVWDLGRKSMESKMIDAYIVGSDAILMVYDLSRKSTFSYIHECYMIVKKLYGKNPLPYMGIIGNKADLTHTNEVKMEDHLKLTELYKIKGFFMSAKTGDQLKICFTKVALSLCGLDSQPDEFEKILKRIDSDEFAQSSDEETDKEKLKEEEEENKKIANKKTKACNIM